MRDFLLSLATFRRWLVVVLLLAGVVPAGAAVVTNYECRGAVPCQAVPGGAPRPAGKATGAQGPLAELAPPPAGPNPYAHARISTRLLAGANHTHGYEVLVDGRVLVAQPSIPGRLGNAGFRTPAEAQRVAALVARKVRANELPPTVTEAELRRLHAGQ